MSTPQTQKSPARADPFIAIGQWTPDKISKLKIMIDDPIETTSDITIRRNAKARYWKCSISFEYDGAQSKTLKMVGCNIPYTKKTNYGTDYFYACLQIAVANALQRAASSKGIETTRKDKYLPLEEDSWWCTVNGVSGKAGIVGADASFDPKDLQKVFIKTQKGIRANMDLVFNLKLSTVDRDKTAGDVFSLSVDCNKCAIMSINEDIQSPVVDAGIPMKKASKADVASAELVTEIDQLMLE